VESLLRKAGLADNQPSCRVISLGRVPFDRVRSLYAESHFSVLLREGRRYARAGFPTKAVESWSMGCPVIANAVGDFGSMISHMENSILVDLESLESDLISALRPMLTGEQYAAMSRECWRSAKRYFSEDGQWPGFLAFARRLAPEDPPDARLRPTF
jgi:glycosyltransferase involved in cell wall biosynthesis